MAEQPPTGREPRSGRWTRDADGGWTPVTPWLSPFGISIITEDSPLTRALGWFLSGPMRESGDR